MVTKLMKWGNSLGLRIPKSFAKEAGVEEGSAVNISLEGDRLVIRPLRTARYQLSDLLFQVREDNRHEEISTGDAVGGGGLVMPRMYSPERGDIVWLEFCPQAGHEQAGHRPALVVSPKAYNQKVGLALFCPITSNVKGYPFEVLLPEKHKVSGAILSDRVKSLDWRMRKAKRIACVPKDVLEDVLAKILTLLGSESR